MPHHKLSRLLDNKHEITKIDTVNNDAILNQNNSYHIARTLIILV